MRRLPVARLIALGELALLAREHAMRLDPQERHRVVELLRHAHGRPSKLSARERRELGKLVAKAEPQLFARAAAVKLRPMKR